MDSVAMTSDVVRYLAGGGGTITLCGYVAHVISLKMRLRFSRYVVDRAVEQSQRIDPVEIIDAATSKSPVYWLTRFVGRAPAAQLTRLRNPPGVPPRLSDPTGISST